MNANAMMASNEWAKRPADQRFVSLTALADFTHRQKEAARSFAMPNRGVRASSQGRSGLQLEFKRDDVAPVTPTHWSFNQLAGLTKAPAGYLRSLPAPLVADCLNYGLLISRAVEDVGLLIDQEGNQLRAATGPNYGRIWNADLAAAMVDRFGDGVSGEWRVPGIFGERLPEVTKENTTLYAGDRDMFIFLADEERRIDVPNRRGGGSGSMARGFFVWNSEVGSSTIGAAFFLFDYVCMNRIVWGMQEWKEVRIRHTSGAPSRWIEEVAPILQRFSEASAEPIAETIKAAQAKRVDDDLDKFLREREFSWGEIERAKLAHEAEEGRPMETLFDVVTGITAAAKAISWQDDRVDLERRAGALLNAA